MSFFETEETRHLTFEAFAAHPFYIAINRSLVQQALAPLAIRPPDTTLMIVDMACGTGVITRLIAEELTSRGHQARIIAVDPSADALRRAQKSIEEMGAQADLFQGEAVDLPSLVHDAVPLSSATRSTSSPINAQPFGRWPLFLLQAGSLPVIAPSTLAPTSRALSALAVFGYAEQCSGCGKRIQKCSYHARQKR